MTGAEILSVLIGIGIGMLGCLPGMALVGILERATRAADKRYQ